MPDRVIRVLEFDPDLAEHLPHDARREAEARARARVFRVPKGRWTPPEIEPGAFGLLLLRGLMARRLRLGPSASAELVGPTDIIRPWENDLVPALMPAVPEWRVLEDAQVALLDRGITVLIGDYPEIGAALAGRLIRRSRSLAYFMAAQHFVRVENRLLAALWHLASMWGRVTPQGIVVPFRLTHEMLADIVGAQRPTTTTALRSLMSHGRLTRNDARCYVLIGDPPDWTPRGFEV
jgi:CRP/FNR family transcriptional regulator, cyclic AMP receptor protein